MIYFHFELDPTPKGRPRFTNRGKFTSVYTPKKTKDYEENIKFLAMEQYDGKPLTGALKCEIVFYLRRPKSVKRKYPVVKADLDNYLKSLLDSLNNIAYKDDAQIITITASKYYATSGRIEVKISEVK